MASVISSTPINAFEPNDSDSLVWTASKTGDFTVRSAYHLMFAISSHHMSATTSPLLKKLWATRNIQPRIVHFAWRAVSNALPTNARRAAAIPAIDSHCPFNCHEPETTDHILFECPTAKEV